MNILQAKNLYMKAREAYYNSGEPIMTDAEYDKLEDMLKKKCPNWSGLKKTGIKVGKKVEVKLPYFMPSLSKYYPDQVAKYWEKYRGTPRFIYMVKLDGCSVLLRYKDGNPVALITRGDGEYGKDISFFIPYLKQLPKNIKDKSDFCLRCEAIVRKDTFAKKWQDSFQTNRNMVSGLLNRTELHKALRDVDFLVLGIFGKPILQGLKHAKELGFPIVQSVLAKAHGEVKMLEKAHKYDYEADGVVICPADFLYQYKNADKPNTGIVAYKENLKSSEVKAQVVDIIYQVSHTGRIIPKIHIKPVIVQGVTVTYVTCHNAQWMIQRKIGPGAVVSIVRSGDVIPKILGVIKPGELKYPDIPYKQKGVHFVALENTKEQSVKEITHFITTLGVNNVAQGTVNTLYDKGVTSVPRLLLGLQKGGFPHWLQKTFGRVKGKKIFEELHNIVLLRYNWIDLLVASNCFDAGIGERKLQKVVNNKANLEVLCTRDKDVDLFEFLGLGIKEATAYEITKGINKFRQWWKDNGKYFAKPIPPKPTQKVVGKLTGQHISFTGYRNKMEEQRLIDLGATIGGFSNKTTVLLYKEGGKASSKIEKAGDRAMTWEQFCKKFSI